LVYQVNCVSYHWFFLNTLKGLLGEDKAYLVSMGHIISIQFYIFVLMEWEAYLEQKKIDPVAYQQRDPQQYEEFKELFYQMHPNSFTAQKLFLINTVRRLNPLQATAPEKMTVKKGSKPVFRPKTK
jgi:hypothetical protein